MLLSLYMRAEMLLVICISVFLPMIYSSINLPMDIPKAHTFPVEDEYGHQIANEFQILRMERTVSLDDVLANKVSVNIESDHPLYGLSPRQLESTSYTYEIIDVFPLMITNDDVVNVTYFSSNPSSSDWIAAYAPLPTPLDLDYLKTTVPVKYGWCDEDKHYLSTGKGTLQFNMTNLRTSIGFVYYTNKLQSPIYANSTSSSSEVNFNNINQPLRPRIIATGDTDVFNLLWSSANSASPTMKWGTSTGVYTTSVTAATTTIPQSSMCGSPANSTGWRDLGLIHTASLTGMRALAREKVYYIFGDDATNDYSGEYVLQVPPLAGQQPHDRGTRVILFDDLGRGSTDNTYTWNEYGRPSIFTAMSVGAEVMDGKVDAIYHGGDISYATGYIAVWDFFMDMISPMASGTIYLTTVGNHESDWPGTASYYTGTDSGGECGVMTTKLIPMPAPAVTNQPWWSYDVGLIHFIGLSTEHDYTIGSPQYLWLEDDLKNVNRITSPWIIFGGHRAMYINSDYGGSVTSDIVVMDNMIANLEPLLWKYRVNIGFYGHNHVVNRNAAVYNQQVIQHATESIDADGKPVFIHDNPQATVQMVVGTGGAGFTKNAVNPGPDWNELFFYEWGYARVTAVNASYLDWEWMDAESGVIVDHMVIIQDDATKAWKMDSTSSDHNNDALISDDVIIIVVVLGFFLLVGLIAGYFYYSTKKQQDVNRNLLDTSMNTSSSPMKNTSINNNV